MRIGEKCIVFPYNGENFKAYTTQIYNIKDNIIELDIDYNSNLSIGNNIIIEFKNRFTLKRYKGTIRKTSRTNILCAISEHSIQNREFTRVDTLFGTSFYLWGEKNKLHHGLVTNISGNGLVISTEAVAYLGEIILINTLKLSKSELLENISGRIIKFKKVSNDDEGYNELVVNFIYINETDRNNIVKFVNKKQKELKDKGNQNEISELSYLKDYL